MWTTDRLKALALRALVDVVALAALAGVGYLGLCAYHGEQAFQYLNRVVQQQQAQQQRQMPPQARPEPPAAK